MFFETVPGSSDGGTPKHRSLQRLQRENEKHQSALRRLLQKKERDRTNKFKTRSRADNKANLAAQAKINRCIKLAEKTAAAETKTLESALTAAAMRAVDTEALAALNDDISAGKRIANFFERVFQRRESAGGALCAMGLSVQWTPEDAASVMHPMVIDALALVAGGIDRDVVVSALRSVATQTDAVCPILLADVPNGLQAAMAAMKLGARGDSIKTAHLTPIVRLTPAFRCASQSPTQHAFLWRCAFAGLPVMLRSTKVATDALADAALMLAKPKPAVIDYTDGLRVMVLKLCSRCPRALWIEQCAQAARERSLAL